MFLAPIFNSTTQDDDGNPAVGFKIYTYLAGSSTPETTYTDEAGGSTHTNPVVLDSYGLPTGGLIWLDDVAYKFVFTDPNDVPIKTYDDIRGIGDVTVSQDQWIVGPTPTYVSATSFTLVGDQTSTFQVGRRLKLIDSGGTDYGTITVSSFTSLTTITVALDSGSLDSGLSDVSYALLSQVGSSVPQGDFTRRGTLTQISTDAGATAGPLIDLYRDSPSPAASDTIGQIQFNGEDSTGTKTLYGQIEAFISSPTDGAEDSQLNFYTFANGTFTYRVRIGSGLLVGGGSGNGPGTATAENGFYDSSGVRILPLVMETAKNATGTSVSFTGLPATVKRIKGTGVGISGSGTSNINMQLGDSGGFENASYTGGAISLSSSPAIAYQASSTGFALTESISAAIVSIISFTLTLHDASNTWVIEGMVTPSNGNSARHMFSGSKQLSGTLDRLQFIMANGTDTFDAGTFNIQYE